MKIIPSVDILNGKVVRLFQGDYNKITEFDHTPIKAVELFSKHGMNLVHIVNLDGAKSENNHNTEKALEEILNAGFQIQIGGGIRSVEIAKKYASFGAKIVIGTICVKNPQITEEIITTVGQENVVLAFDCKHINGNYEVMINGWQETEKTLLNDMLNFYSKYSVSVLCTDIAVDGTLASPNFALYSWIKKHFPQFFLQASGGISCIEDIIKLKNDKIDGVIIGRALHSGIISIEDLTNL